MNEKCNGRYIIVDGKITPEPDLIKWAMWYEKSENRHVKQDKIGDVIVSTIFLGLDHNLWGNHPILWETMIFGSKANRDFVRCGGNREQAEAMHASVVEKIRSAEKKVPNSL